MGERLKPAVLKTISLERGSGFESLSLRHRVFSFEILRDTLLKIPRLVGNPWRALPNGTTENCGSSRVSPKWLALLS